jgi:hypothetical protein
LTNPKSSNGNLQLKLADCKNLQLVFEDSGSQNVYAIRAETLEKLAENALAEKEYAKNKVLQLLANMCYAWWCGSYPKEQLAKMSACFDDETHQTICAYCKTDSLDLWLKARLAEFAYLREPRHEFANIALQAYAQAPLTWETWYKGCNAFWFRALELEDTHGITPPSPSIKSQLLEAALNQSEAIPYRFNAQLATIFYKCDIEITDEELQQLSTVLDKCALACTDEVSDCQAADLYELLAKWHQKKQNKDEYAQFCYKAANAYIRAANTHEHSLAAVHFYEKAIASLQSIPAKYKGAWTESNQLKFPIDNLVTRLKRIITQEKQFGHDGMQRVAFSIQIPKKIPEGEAKQYVGGKSLLNAFKSLADIAHLPRAEDIKNRAIETLKNSVIPHLGTQHTLTSTGNTSAITPYISDNDSSRAALQKCMVDDFTTANIAIPTLMIRKALSIIQEEHPNANLTDFMEFCTTHCVAIPDKQCKQWATAIFAGYKGDWISAIHLVAPLLENLLRCVLLMNTGQTGTIKDKNGTDNEISLNTLIKKQELITLLGEDVIFALDALFCNSLGSNLRNAVAHGLVDDDGCKSNTIIYAWWLALFLACQFTFESSETMGAPS